MFTRTLTSLLTLTLLAGCASTSSDSAQLESCHTQVERWANNSQSVQGQPQEDGGIIFVKPGIDSAHFFIIVSDLHAPTVHNEVKQGQEAKTIGTVKEGVCAHPANGYPYRTFQLTLTPVKQRASL